MAEGSLRNTQNHVPPAAFERTQKARGERRVGGGGIRASFIDFSGVWVMIRLEQLCLGRSIYYTKTTVLNHLSSVCVYVCI